MLELLELELEFIVELTFINAAFATISITIEHIVVNFDQIAVVDHQTAVVTVIHIQIIIIDNHYLGSSSTSFVDHH